MSWIPLGRAAPCDLVEARLQLHHAAQIAASAGVTFLEPQPDDSHPNLEWVHEVAALVGRALPASRARVGLRVEDLTLVLVEPAGPVCETLSIAGKTLEEGYAWLGEATARAGEALPAAGLSRAAYEIPDHPVATGARFSDPATDACAELANWFANGHDALCEVVTRTTDASDVRCWPHHFDLGSLLVLETQPDGSLAKSIGIGLSPGDETYAEPYWYVSPWPYPASAALPALPNGSHWHTAGYTSAILTGSALLETPREQQHARVRSFLSTSVEASRRALSDARAEE